MDTEHPDSDAPDPVAEAAEASTDDLMVELVTVTAYRQNPDLLPERAGYLSGLLIARGVNPATYTVGAGDSTTLPEGDQP